MNAPQPALQPVVGAGDRPRQPSQRSRQHGPNQHEIRVAPVIGKIDARPRIGGAAAPLAAHAGDEPCEGGDGRRARRLDQPQRPCGISTPRHSAIARTALAIREHLHEQGKNLEPQQPPCPGDASLDRTSAFGGRQQAESRERRVGRGKVGRFGRARQSMEQRRVEADANREVRLGDAGERDEHRNSGERRTAAVR